MLNLNGWKLETASENAVEIPKGHGVYDDDEKKIVERDKEAIA